MIPFGKPLLGDEERGAAADVLAGTTLTHGPKVKEFEAAFADFTGAPYAIATATCMASLHLAYLFLDIGPGDEVIVPAQTHVAMAHAVQAVGAKPVFLDSEPRTGGVDLDQLEALITPRPRAARPRGVDLDQLEALIPPRTRAISVVHYLGLPVDLGRVLDLARRHDC